MRLKGIVAAKSARSRGRVRRAILIVSALAPALLVAQNSPQPHREGRYWVVEETGSMPAGGVLRVSSIGRVVVRGVDSERVRYRAVKRLRAADLNQARRSLNAAKVAMAQQGGGAVVVSLSDPRCGRCAFDAELEIEVPIDTRQAVLVTERGRIEAQGVSGDVNAESSSGSIALNAIGGSVGALTAGGDIELGAIGGAVRCETAGGNISLKQSMGDASLNTSGGSIRAGRVGGLLRAETLGGSIEVAVADGGVFAGTSGGSIRLGRVGGRISASTAGGSIQVASAPQGVRAETAAGDIRLEQVGGEVFAASASGDIRAYFVGGSLLRGSLLETMRGSIVVFLPADLGVTIDAAVDLAKSLNRITSDFTTIQIRRETAGPGVVTAQGHINGGGPVLRIQNTGGRIEIRRQP